MRLEGTRLRDLFTLMVWLLGDSSGQADRQAAILFPFAPNVWFLDAEAFALTPFQM